jgi:tyrosyl-DNA phosphodiesterase-1
VAGEVRIASWEIGVLVWPGLLADDSVMVGTFQTDTPTAAQAESWGGGRGVVGLRMPYSMPLQKYGERTAPWVATKPYPEPDSLGRTWGG